MQSSKEEQEEIKKPSLPLKCKEIEENNRMRLEISSRQLEIAIENFMQRWA